MSRILKIFASADEQTNIINGYPVIEQYDGFVLAKVPANKVKDIHVCRLPFAVSRFLPIADSRFTTTMF